MPVILVVEDEAEVREVIVEALTQWGYEVREAATAGDVFATGMSERPDAVLLDIVLPDARGTETLDRLRAVWRDVPIIMLTANADEDLARETLKRGAFDYIMKPFSVDHLERVVEAAIRASSAERD